MQATSHERVFIPESPTMLKVYGCPDGKKVILTDLRKTGFSSLKFIKCTDPYESILKINDKTIEDNFYGSISITILEKHAVFTGNYIKITAIYENAGHRSKHYFNSNQLMQKEVRSIETGSNSPHKLRVLTLALPKHGS